MMKATALLLLASTSFPALAGPIKAGGPRQNLYRAVCDIRTNSQDPAPYKIFVAFSQDSAFHETKVYGDPDSNPRLVAQLTAKQIFTQRIGTNETYVAINFTLDIQSDRCSPSGGKDCGRFSGVIEGEIVKGVAQCQLFDQN